MTDSNDSMKVMTANRLADGAIVYLKLADGRPDWVTDITAATAFSEAETAAMQAIADADAEGNVVVSPYVIDTTKGNAPTSAKESVRAAGPSVEYGHAARATDFKR